MKTIALMAAIVISSTFVLEPAAASAGNTSRWIQMGISAANTARKVSKNRRGDDALSLYGNNNSSNSQSLVPKLFRKR